MNDSPAPFASYFRHAAGSDGLQHQVYNQVQSGPGNQLLVASDLGAGFQQHLQKLADPSSWQQFQVNPTVQLPNGQLHFHAEHYNGLEAQEGNVPQLRGIEAPSSLHQAVQDYRANPANFQHLEYGVGLSRFQAQDILAAHSAQTGGGPPYHLLKYSDFRRGLSTSHEHPMESIGSGRLDDQAVPPRILPERSAETAEPQADPCKGPQIVFTVEEHPCEDLETLDGLSPPPPTPEVTVIREAPQWAPVSLVGGARVERHLGMKPADKKLLKWVFGSEYPLHWG